MYFATVDINEVGLKVRAGRPLPDRFQAYEPVKNLRRTFGNSAIIKIDSTTDGYVLVDAKQLAALKKENAKLKEQISKAGS